MNKHLKRCSISFFIREMKIETTMRYHYTGSIHLPEWLKLKTDDTKYGKDAGQVELPYIASGNV